MGHDITTLRKRIEELEHTELDPLARIPIDFLGLGTYDPPDWVVAEHEKGDYILKQNVKTGKLITELEQPDKYPDRTDLALLEDNILLNPTEFPKRLGNLIRYCHP